MRARGEGLCDPVDALFLDAARPTESATAQNACRILSRLTEPMLRPELASTWSLCSLK